MTKRTILAVILALAPAAAVPAAAPQPDARRCRETCSAIAAECTYLNDAAVCEQSRRACTLSCDERAETPAPTRVTRRD